jgi:hypothetical protein
MAKGTLRYFYFKVGRVKILVDFMIIYDSILN